MPDTSTPDLNIPNTLAPVVKPSTMDIPDTLTPDIEVPDTSTPEVKPPDSKIPSTLSPKSKSPVTEMPDSATHVLDVTSSSVDNIELDDKEETQEKNKQIVEQKKNDDSIEEGELTDDSDGEPGEVMITSKAPEESKADELLDEEWPRPSVESVKKKRTLMLNLSKSEMKKQETGTKTTDLDDLEAMKAKLVAELQDVENDTSKDLHGDLQSKENKASKQNKDTSSNIDFKDSSKNKDRSSNIDCKDSSKNKDRSSNIDCKDSSKNKDRSSNIDCKDSSKNKDRSSNIDCKDSSKNKDRSSNIDCKDSSKNKDRSSNIDCKDSSKNKDTSSNIDCKDSSRGEEKIDKLKKMLGWDEPIEPRELRRFGVFLNTSGEQNQKDHDFIPKGDNDVTDYEPEYEPVPRRDQNKNKFKNFVSKTSVIPFTLGGKNFKVIITESNTENNKKLANIETNKNSLKSKGNDKKNTNTRNQKVNHVWSMAQQEQQYYSPQEIISCSRRPLLKQNYTPQQQTWQQHQEYQQAGDYQAAGTSYGYGTQGCNNYDYNQQYQCNQYNYNQQPNGSYMQPNGSYMQPNGSYMQPNGSYMQPNGSYMQPNGSYMQPNGSYMQPNGSYGPNTYGQQNSMQHYNMQYNTPNVYNTQYQQDTYSYPQVACQPEAQIQNNVSIPPLLQESEQQHPLPSKILTLNIPLPPPPEEEPSTVHQIKPTIPGNDSSLEKTDKASKQNLPPPNSKLHSNISKPSEPIIKPLVPLVANLKPQKPEEESTLPQLETKAVELKSTISQEILNLVSDAHLKQLESIVNVVEFNSQQISKSTDSITKMTEDEQIDYGNQPISQECDMKSITRTESPNSCSKSSHYRPRSSIRRSRSPPYKSRSQHYRSRSPCRRSPCRRSRSPYRRSRSPQRRSRSPQRRSRSPQRRSRSPCIRSKSPRQRSRSPCLRTRSRYRSKSPLYRVRSPRFRSRSRSRYSRSQSPYYRSKSPNYRPTSTIDRSTSPNYRPISPYDRPISPNYRSSFPNYRPISPNYRSSTPNYRPISPNDRPISPNYRSFSPNYRPISPNDHTISPNHRSLTPNYRPISPNDRPISPNYRSTSPNNRPVSPLYQSTSQNRCMTPEANFSSNLQNLRSANLQCNSNDKRYVFNAIDSQRNHGYDVAYAEQKRRLHHLQNMKSNENKIPMKQNISRPLKTNSQKIKHQSGVTNPTANLEEHKYISVLNKSYHVDSYSLLEDDTIGDPFKNIHDEMVMNRINNFLKDLPEPRKKVDESSKFFISLINKQKRKALDEAISSMEQVMQKNGSNITPQPCYACGHIKKRTRNMFMQTELQNAEIYISKSVSTYNDHRTIAIQTGRDEIDNVKENLEIQTAEEIINDEYNQSEASDEDSMYLQYDITDNYMYDIDLEFQESKDHVPEHDDPQNEYSNEASQANVSSNTAAMDYVSKMTGSSKRLVQEIQNSTIENQAVVELQKSKKQKTTALQPQIPVTFQKEQVNQRGLLNHPTGPANVNDSEIFIHSKKEHINQSVVTTHPLEVSKTLFENVNQQKESIDEQELKNNNQLEPPSLDRSSGPKSQQSNTKYPLRPLFDQPPSLLNLHFNPSSHMNMPHQQGLLPLPQVPIVYFPNSLQSITQMSDMQQHMHISSIKDRTIKNLKRQITKLKRKLDQIEGPTCINSLQKDCSSNGSIEKSSNSTVSNQNNNEKVMQSTDKIPVKPEINNSCTSKSEKSIDKLKSKTKIEVKNVNSFYSKKGKKIYNKSTQTVVSTKSKCTQANLIQTSHGSTTNVPVSDSTTKITAPGSTTNVSSESTVTVSSESTTNVPESTTKISTRGSSRNVPVPESAAKITASESSTKETVSECTSKIIAPVSMTKITAPVSTAKITAPVSTEKITDPVSTAKITAPSSKKVIVSDSMPKITAVVSTPTITPPVSTTQLLVKQIESKCDHRIEETRLTRTELLLSQMKPCYVTLDKHDVTRYLEAAISALMSKPEEEISVVEPRVTRQRKQQSSVNPVPEKKKQEKISIVKTEPMDDTSTITLPIDQPKTDTTPKTDTAPKVDTAHKTDINSIFKNENRGSLLSNLLKSNDKHKIYTAHTALKTDTSLKTDITPKTNTTPRTDMAPRSDTAPRTDMAPRTDTAPKSNTASSTDTAPTTDIPTEMIIPPHMIKPEPVEEKIMSEIKCEETVLQEADAPSNIPDLEENNEKTSNDEMTLESNFQDPPPPKSIVSIPIIKIEPQDVTHEVNSVEIEPLVSIPLTDIQLQDKSSLTGESRPSSSNSNSSLHRGLATMSEKPSTSSTKSSTRLPLAKKSTSKSGISKAKVQQKPNNSSLKRSVYNLCKKQFAPSLQLSQHLQSHVTPKTLNVCTICGQSFDTPYVLKCHMGIHTVKEKKHLCFKCGKRFTELIQLQYHENIIHKDKNNVLYKCEECKVEFETLELLDLHKKSIHIPGTFKCTICYKHFSSNMYLGMHMKKMHLGILLKCQYCNYCCDNQENFQKHLFDIHNVV